MDDKTFHPIVAVRSMDDWSLLMWKGRSYTAGLPKGKDGDFKEIWEYYRTTKSEETFITVSFRKKDYSNAALRVRRRLAIAYWNGRSWTVMSKTPLRERFLKLLERRLAKHADGRPYAYPSNCRTMKSFLKKHPDCRVK